MDTRQKNQAADPAALISTSSLSEHSRDASHEFLATHPTMEPSPNKPNTREKQNENTSQASQSSRSHLTKEPSTKPSKETSPARKWKCMARNSGFTATSSFGPNSKFKRQRLARNYLTHGNVVREPQDVITRAENVVASLRASITQGQVDTSSKTNNPSQTWQSPPQPWYKVNIDAAVSSKADHAGIGVLVRNSAGDVMVASISQVPFLGDVEFVEALAVYKRLRLTSDIGLTPAIIESDSLNEVNLIGNKIASRCEVGWVISEIQEALTSSHSTVQVLFAPRTCNEATLAHHLAKLALYHPIEQVWIEEPPSEISTYVYKDKNM
ncbi:hypothetical protein WN943_007665 [Citrus x changshan-huyou]